MGKYNDDIIEDYDEEDDDLEFVQHVQIIEPDEAEIKPVELATTDDSTEKQPNKSLTGAEYVLTKVNFCNKYFNEDACDIACPLRNYNEQGEIICMHAEINTSDDYVICETIIQKWLDNTSTNLAILKECFPQFDTKYLSEEGQSWVAKKYEGGKMDND